jgi:nitrite reductase (NADH) small subunit
MALVKVGPLDVLPPGSVAHVEFDEDAIAVCNVDGNIYAIDGICPHSGGPLGHGALHGTMLICPYHAWGFDCVTGESDVDEELKLRTHPVKVENGEIWVEVSLP